MKKATEYTRLGLKSALKPNLLVRDSARQG